MLDGIAILVLFVWLWRVSGEVRALRLRLADDREVSAPPPTPRETPRPAATVVRRQPSATVPSVQAPAPRFEPRREPTHGIGTTLEELFGAKLAVWAGGVTLAVAGLFLVRYSIDAGLLPPPVRVLAGLLFAGVLVAAAERARSWAPTADDPRVAQSLAGAGVASAYLSVLAAAKLYALVAPVAAFFDLAGVTIAALPLALRFGAPSAVLGLVGGLAAPALVGGAEGNASLLAIYLMLVVGALAGVARRREWRWLATASLAGGFGWAAILIGAGSLDPAGTTAVGALLVMLALVAPALAGGAGDELLLRLASGAAGALGMSGLIARGGFGALEWSLYALLAAGSVLLARVDRRQWPLPPLALAVAIAVIGFWPDPDAALLCAVVAGTVLILGTPALTDAARPTHGRIAALQGAAALLAAPALLWMKLPTLLPDLGWAELLGAGAATAALAAVRCRARSADAFDILAVTAALLLAGAETFALPGDFLVGALAASAALLAYAGRQRPRLAAPAATLTLAGLAALGAALAALRWTVTEAPALVGTVVPAAALPGSVSALLDLLLPAALLAALPLADERLRRAARALSAGATFVALHIFWRSGFDALGLSGGTGERVLLTALLLGAGIALLRRERQRSLALALLALGLARAGWFELLVCNPFVDDRSVGPVPILNWLAPAYLLPVAALRELRRREPGTTGPLRPLATGAEIALVLMFVFATVRQLFQGGILADSAMGAGENLLHTLATIATAIGFLRFGALRGEQAWRRTALALMVGVLLKVFLWDGASLEGLMRILSFVALGLALIGVGWLDRRLASRSTAA